MNFAAGVVLVIGPGRNLLDLVPNPKGTVRDVIELPTAVPYFAVIGGIVGSNATLPEQILLVAIYNLCFVAPMVAIAGVLLLMGQRALRWLDRAAAWLQRRWPVAMASLLMLVGSILTILGGSGLLKP